MQRNRQFSAVLIIFTTGIVNGKLFFVKYSFAIDNNRYTPNDGKPATTIPQSIMHYTKKWSFSLRIFLVNVIKYLMANLIFCTVKDWTFSRIRHSSLKCFSLYSSFKLLQFSYFEVKFSIFQPCNNLRFNSMLEKLDGLK